jgi:subtilisin family serine protease
MSGEDYFKKTRIKTMNTKISILLSLNAGLFALTISAQPIPNDPMFAQQYGLAKIGATNAWAVSTGSSNVVVAIVSTGVNYNHEDLQANMWRNPGEIPGNGIDDDANGYVDDVHGIDTVGNGFSRDGDPMDEGVYYPTLGQFYHGTANAGIIGAAANNGVGIAGVNWSVRLMALRASATSNVRESNVVAALDYISLMKDRGVNIRVVHLPYFFLSVSHAFREAHERIAARGILQVAIPYFADWNHDLSPVYPAALRLPGMITVACLDQSDNLVPNTGYGRTSMDLAAPSLDVVTTSGESPGSYRSYPGGTEAGGAHVAGAAALLFAIAPEATAEDVKTALLETVDVLPSLSDKVATSGRLNLGNAARHRRIVSKALRFTSIRRVADGTTRLALQAPMRVEVDVETSANLVTWTSLTTLSFDRQIEVSAPAAPNDESRFFRARLVSP